MRVERAPSLATLVTDRMRQEIVEGQFEFGEALSESKIANRYEVSRTPVREAFARLELEELVHTEPQFGTFVFTMDRERFAQISEVRSILECAALRLSFERNRKPLEDRWMKIVARLDKAAQNGNTKAYSAADGAFHDVLFELSGNSYLNAARLPFVARLAAIRNRLGLSAEHVEKSRAEHAELLELIAAKRLRAAVGLLDRHITKKGAQFWSVPEKSPKPKWDRYLLKD